MPATRLPLRAALLGVALLAAAQVGCASTGSEPPDGSTPWTAKLSQEATQLEAQLGAVPAGSAGSVSIHLAFPEDTDLDLYVTGPLEETVYYGNTPSAIGGEFVADRHCKEAESSTSADGPRVETIRFETGPSGAYRIGVDYPHSCGGDRRRVPFIVLVETPQGRQIERGLASFEQFQPIVLGFDSTPEETPDAP